MSAAASEDNPPPKPPSRRPRLLWTLLGAMVLVGVLPLLVSHIFLIGINRDSMETLEKKFLTRSAVGISTDLQNLLASNRQQLTNIAGSIRMMKKALPDGADPFLYAAQSQWVAESMTPSSDLIALRAVNSTGQGAEAVTTPLDATILGEMEIARQVALKGTDSTGRITHVAATNLPVVVMAVPVREGGNTIGAIVGLVSLRRIVDRIRDEGKGDVAAFLVDRDGRVLVHSEPAVDVQHPNFSHLKLVQEFSKANVPLRLTESYDDRGVKLLGTVAPAPPNVGVIVQKPERRAFASVDEMIRATAQWVAIALVLAIVASVLFASGIARPIRILTDRSREIAQGNYQQRVELKTHTEIGELAQNFNVMSESIEAAIAQLKKAAHENHLLFLNSVRMLAAAIDAKDPYTRGHSERVARYSIGIGKNLSLPEKDMRNLRISALLHDVGKIGIDDRILRKPGALSDEEFEVMKQHPAKGAAIMSGVAQLIDIIPGMKYHHEKWSGGGYPDGLEGEQIPMQARIVAIADTFDAMTTNRPYQKAMELGYVVEKIKSFAGTRFDPRVVDAFVSAVKRGDISIEEQVRGAA
ncbi:MAG TPA: HD domain-containing phosphohydrolase [Thermoanaerobaculia bacterium]|jgi:HD-GYP domain-containing protein (c-di-GMP phosphodiesterase class II)